MRQLQQILPALREPQAATLPIPDRCAELLLDFPDGMAERRLREVQRICGRGQRALALDLTNDDEMESFQHGYRSRNRYMNSFNG